MKGCLQVMYDKAVKALFTTLKEMFEIQRFIIESRLGARYLPLSSLFVKLDKENLAFLAIKVEKI